MICLIDFRSSSLSSSEFAELLTFFAQVQEHALPTIIWCGSSGYSPPLLNSSALEVTLLVTVLT